MTLHQCFRGLLLLLLCIGLAIGAVGAAAQLVDSSPVVQEDETGTTDFCPVTGVQARGTDFTGTGVILTAFNPASTWHLDVASGRRFPLPDLPPCGRTCRLAPDGLTLIYFNDLTNAHNTMRIDGVFTEFLTERAADATQWDDTTYFGWTPAAYPFTIQNEARGERIPFGAIGLEDALYSIQRGGAWAIASSYDGERFQRALVSLDDETLAPVSLGEDRPYFNDYGWSPDGSLLAYVIPQQLEDDAYTAELKVIRLNGSGAARSLTDLHDEYGQVYLNGLGVDEIAWSPDSAQIAFWVTTIEPETDTPFTATLHTIDVATGTLTRYCGLEVPRAALTTHTPRLFWSPDGAYIGFAVSLDDDNRGAFVAALDVSSGVYTAVSDGLYAAYGQADIYGWGRRP